MTETLMQLPSSLWRSETALRFHKKYLIFFPNMNEILIGLEQHEGE